MNQQSKTGGCMTVKEFNAAVSVFPRLSAKGKIAAHLVLVGGCGQAEVANKLSIHRQQVHRWVMGICPTYAAKNDGWESAMSILPPDLLKEVKSMERKARRE